MNKIEAFCKCVDVVKPLFAIGCICAIELVALSQGIDGVALAASIAGISGLGGYYFKILRDKSSIERLKRREEEVS